MYEDDVCAEVEISLIQRNCCGIFAVLMVASESDLHAAFLLCAHRWVSWHCAVLERVCASGVLLCAYHHFVSLVSCLDLRWEDLGCQCRRYPN